jgi:hypothetical protein
MSKKNLLLIERIRSATAVLGHTSGNGASSMVALQDAATQFLTEQYLKSTKKSEDIKEELPY